MAKKRVPDWLNSSLWYSRPPDNERFLSYADAEPEPPVSEPPPSAARPEPPKPTTDASRSRNDDDNGVPGGPSVEEISRQSQLLAELSKKVINMRELRRIASQGITDGAGIRPVVWKLLLGYLPPDRALWSSELAKKRSQYKSFKAEILMEPKLRGSWRNPQVVTMMSQNAKPEASLHVQKYHMESIH